jgi:hypothetical protein
MVRSVGGTILCAFPDADEAVAASVEMQRQVSEETFSTAESLVMRMGMHAGTVAIRSGAYSGEAMTTAARLVTMARPGQILATEEVLKRLPETSHDRLRLMPGGRELEERLKVRLYIVPWKKVPVGGGETVEQPAEPETPSTDTGPQRPLSKRRTNVVRLAVQREEPGEEEQGLADDDISVNPTAKQKTAHHERPPRPVTRTQEDKEQAVQRRKIILREVREQRAKTEVPGAKETVAPGTPKARLCLIWRENVLVVDAGKPSLTLGRDESNDVVIGVETASRRHAEIRLRAGEYFLIDRSSNGTFVYDETGDEYYVEQAEVKLGACGAVCPGCPQEEVGAEAILYWMAAE